MCRSQRHNKRTNLLVLRSVSLIRNCKYQFLSHLLDLIRNRTPVRRFEADALTTWPSEEKGLLHEVRCIVYSTTHLLIEIAGIYLNNVLVNSSLVFNLSYEC